MDRRDHPHLGARFGTATGIPGSFLWEWQDRAVADKCKTKLYDFDPATGVSYVKNKGLVDGWRNPRPDYYAVKMEYSPIKVGQEARYDFPPRLCRLEHHQPIFLHGPALSGHPLAPAP